MRSAARSAQLHLAWRPARSSCQASDSDRFLRLSFLWRLPGGRRATSSARRVVLASRADALREAQGGPRVEFGAAAGVEPRGGEVSALRPAPERYGELLETKAHAVRTLLGERLAGVPLHVVASPPLHHRMRCAFFLWHDGADVRFCVEQRSTRSWAVVEEYPIASERLCRLMVDLRLALRESLEARRGAFEVELVANTDGDALVCLLYRHDLDDSYAEVAEDLAARLGCTVVGRSPGKRVVAGPGRLVQRHVVEGRLYPQLQQELMFSQSNASVCAEMLRWAAAQARSCASSCASSGASSGEAGGEATATGRRRHRGKNLLELHCGNGSFTLPLAQHFDRVLATEAEAGSLKFAEECASWAGVSNLHFARLSAEEVEEALRRERVFERLTKGRLNLAGLDFDTVLVDPPRRGLDAPGLAIVASARRCLYFSCSPGRLAQDLAALPRHVVVAAAFFDQFPYTEHAEVAVLLEQL